MRVEPGLTRRELLARVGTAGGYGAAYLVMQSLGLLASAQAYQGPPALPGDDGKHVSVVILGAGLAGMTAAYELGRAGYQCTILEARHRVGGRNWTLRRDSSVEELGQPAQPCQFDDGLYFNPGPARIPGHHRALLGYCKQFGVPLEVFVNANRSTFFHDRRGFDGQPKQSRRVHHDSAGHIAELLAKAINKNALDDELSTQDKGRVLGFLRGFGDLDHNLTYQGSARAGYSTPPGPVQPPVSCTSHWISRPCSTPVSGIGTCISKKPSSSRPPCCNR